MKQKQKPQPNFQQSIIIQNQYSSHKSMSKKCSSTSHTRSHLPLTNKNSKVVKNSKHQQSIIYDSIAKPTSHNKIRSSPYVELPSLPNQNNQNLNLSNVSGNGYYSQPSNQYSANSIYEKLRLDTHHKKGFCTQESEENYYVSQNINRHNNEINTRRKHNNIKENNYNGQFNDKPTNNNRSQCHHKSPNFTKKYQSSQPQYYYGHQNIQTNQDNHSLYSQNKSQQLIKKHINQKLNRVCQKIDNLSREKDSKPQQKNQHKTGIKIQWREQNSNTVRQNKKSTPKLCYSSLVYQQDKHIHKTPSSSSSNYQNQAKHQDNIIQHRILSPPKPTHQQFLESRIIQMDKKITISNSKILKLQEDLLQQRQKLIRKEKQWLLRQNELLNWIEENQVQQEEQYQTKQSSPQKWNSSKVHKSRISVSNVVVNDSEQREMKEQLKCYREMLSNCYELIKKMLGVFKLSQNWVNLMNRTISQQLPGTAFRVKEQMNLNSKLFRQIQSQCLKQVKQFQPLQMVGSSARQAYVSRSNNLISPLSSQQVTPIPSANQSQVFLLQSYCPPTSQLYQISTKRNSSSIKNSSRKSLLCVSQSKSTTNKKNHIISTQKKNHTKSRQKDTKQSQFVKPQVSVSRCLYESRKSQNFCDEVFYDKVPIIDEQVPNNCQSQQAQYPDQLYYMLSLQALSIQNLMQNSSTQHSSPNNQKQDENLLDTQD